MYNQIYRSKSVLKILCYTHHVDVPLLYDISTPEKEEKAFYDLYEFLEYEECYDDLKYNDHDFSRWSGKQITEHFLQQSLYNKAAEGDKKAARELLELRNNYDNMDQCSWSIVDLE